MGEGEAGGEEPHRRRGPVAVVLNDRVYRTIFLILVVQGVMFGGQMPFMPLWAKDQLGAGSVEVGVISLVSSLVSTGFGLAYGIVTDRTRRRVSWIVVAYAVALPVRIALVYVTSLAVGAVLYALVGMAMFVLFYAILGDWLRYRRDPQLAEVMNIVRLGFTLGWLTGAFGAGWFVTRFGYDGMFLGTAVLHALSMALLVTGVRDAPMPDPTQGGRATDVEGTPLWLDLVRPAVAWYLITTVCTGAASVARMTLLPLYLRDVVQADADAVGIVFGIEPVYEIPVSLLAGAVVGRFGVERLMLVGIGAGVLYFGAVALTTTFVPFLAIEALYAVVVTATFGFGLVHVQNLMPRRGGTAVAAYNAAGTVGPLFAAPGLGWGADNVGWTSVYVAAAMLMAIALATMWMSDRANRTERLLRS
jgi:MFS family permease